MGRKFCIWCESYDEPVGEFFWIHKQCFEDLCDVSSDIKHVSEMLVKAKGIPEIVSFLKSMEDFRRRWNVSMGIRKGVERRGK